MKCKTCGASEHDPCQDCGQIVHIGDWPFCPHGSTQSRKGFEPYFDYGLGKMMYGAGDIKDATRSHWKDDHIVRFEDQGRGDSYTRQLKERIAARRSGELK